MMDLSAIALPPSPAQAPVGDAYLKFRLTPQTAAMLSMKEVQEALILPTRRLTLMPNMPPCMVGLTNRRNRVAWVVDLPQLLDLPELDTSLQQYPIVMIQVGAVLLGLMVHQIDGLVWFKPEEIQTAIEPRAATLAMYLRGCALQQQEQQQEILLVLDAEAIVQSPALMAR